MSAEQDALPLLLLVSAPLSHIELSFELSMFQPESYTSLRLLMLMPPGSNVWLRLRPLVWWVLLALLGLLLLLRLVPLMSSHAVLPRMSLSQVFWLWLGACACGFALGFTLLLLVFGMLTCSFVWRLFGLASVVLDGSGDMTEVDGGSGASS